MPSFNETGSSLTGSALCSVSWIERWHCSLRWTKSNQKPVSKTTALLHTRHLSQSQWKVHAERASMCVSVCCSLRLIRCVFSWQWRFWTFVRREQKNWRDWLTNQHHCQRISSLSYRLTSRYTHTHSLSHTHTLSHTYTHTLSHTLTLSHTHTHTHSHTHSLTRTHTHTHSLTQTCTLSLTLSHTHTHTHTFLHSLSHMHTRSFSLSVSLSLSLTHSLSHSLTHSLTHSLSLTHTLSHTHTHPLYLCCGASWEMGETKCFFCVCYFLLNCLTMERYS